MQIKIGIKLKTLRESRKIDLDGMAGLLAMPTAAYLALESNEISTELRELICIAEKLQIPVYEFLSETLNSDDLIGSHEPLFWQTAALAFVDYGLAIETLAEKPLPFFFEFEEILAKKLHLLDRKTFAAGLFGKDGISSDDFLYVRCFTIAQGKDFFDKVLSNEIQMPNHSFEPLLTLAEKAYSKKLCEEFPTFRTSVSYETGNNLTYWT